MSTAAERVLGSMMPGSAGREEAEEATMMNDMAGPDQRRIEFVPNP